MKKSRRKTAMLKLSQTPGSGPATLGVAQSDPPAAPGPETDLLRLMEEMLSTKAALEAANRELAEEVADRQRAEAEVRRLNEQLEDRVKERTWQLIAANQELEAFAYSVSHDLRGPVRHIQGFAGRLARTAGPLLTDQSRNYLQQIESSAQEMEALIEELLVFSRTSRAELKKGPLPLPGLLDEALRQLEPETQGRNVLWQKAGLPVVHGDATLLRQVLINLLSNALKFTRPRNPARIEVGSVAGAEREVVVFVRDNGVGFDMQYVDRLFGVFQRLHAPEEFEGTGIGLANVRRIIARHGGRTWAEGRVNQGATFFFALPREPGE